MHGYVLGVVLAAEPPKTTRKSCFHREAYTRLHLRTHVCTSDAVNAAKQIAKERERDNGRARERKEPSAATVLSEVFLALVKSIKRP